uniref:Protein-lysine N-methyltransferase SMYD4 n=1 Tax=Callorhinchus milii TaxID=7868 RepID=A0A4W3JAH4_CALMI
MEVVPPPPVPVTGWQDRSGGKWRRLGEADRRRFRSLTEPEDEAVLTALVAQIQTGKDPAAAQGYKERGNEQFKAGDYARAAGSYTKGISHASQDSSEIAILYANRSAALCHLQRYRVSLSVTTCSCALAHGYPPALEPKLLVRRAECQLHLGSAQQFLSAVAQAESKLSELGGQTATWLRRRLGQLQPWAPPGDTPSPGPSARLQADEERPLLENETLPGASRSVRLRFDGVRGRHLVATKDFAAGETVLREEAYAAVLLARAQPSPQDSHCHHCLSQAWALLPCPSCSYATYCSALCRQKAWADHHQVECPLGSELLALGAFAHLSLRMVLAAGLEEVQRTQAAQSGPRSSEAPRATEPGDGAEAEGRWEAHPPYRAVHSLLAHTHQQSAQHRFLCGLTAAALCSRIRAKGLEPLVVGKGLEAGDGGGQAMGALGTALLTHMLQLGCNAQAITQLRDTGKSASNHLVEGSEQVRIATAVYCTLSLLNHSCRPNTSLSFCRQTVTIRASQPIQAGQEILHCYGPHWCRLAVSERQRALRAQYFFECECSACSGEQEAARGGGGGAAELGQFLCPRCGSALQVRRLSRCSNTECGQVLPESLLLSRRAELAEQLSAASGLIDEDRTGTAISFLCPRSLGSPQHGGEACSALTLASLSPGNWAAAADHLKRSLAAVRARYGSSSVECGQELYKLSQILFNGRAVTEALSVIEEAVEVLTVHRGRADQMVEELREMRSCLESVLPPQRRPLYPLTDCESSPRERGTQRNRLPH